MASYPDQPGNNGGSSIVTTTTPITPLPPSIQPESLSQPSVTSPTLAYDGLASSDVSANPAMHHGLQALQATVISPSLPNNTADLVQQYAQSAALRMGEASYSPPVAHASSSTSTPGENPSSQKVTRLRRACDMCSQRKVKCDESGPPCKPCADLGVGCTFSREMKRRGPPNKHAEAAKAGKRTRVDDPSPARRTSLETLESMSAQNGSTLDAEAIAPLPILRLLVDDFFTYLHPLMPFPHELTFREAFAKRADKNNAEFLTLLASMIAVLVASFPRSARSHLKAQKSVGLFSSASAMVEHCRSIALEARGLRFMAKEQMSVDDAAASYFLGIAAAYTMQWHQFKRFMAETITFCRELGAHRQRDQAGNVPDLPPEIRLQAQKPIDHVQDQIGKRIFWVMVAGVRSMNQLGVSVNELPLSPPTTQEPYPDLPLEIDDEFIFPDQVYPQPEGTLSVITGFNRNIRIYLTMNELVGVDMAYGIMVFDWTAQRNILSNGLSAAKSCVDDMPLELTVKIEPGQANPPSLDDSGLQYCPPAFPDPQPTNDLRHVLAEQPERRRQLQFEIQKANIYASQLATRSYFVERYLNLRDVHRAQSNYAGSEGAENKNDIDDERAAMWANERELVVQNLLTVLASISQRNMEPNGSSLINKIRQIASTLLNDAPERKGPVAIKAEQYLGRFVEILMKLENNVTERQTEDVSALDEEQELQHWASLREHQLQFLSSGGFLRST